VKPFPGKRKRPQGREIPEKPRPLLPEKGNLRTKRKLTRETSLSNQSDKASKLKA